MSDQFAKQILQQQPPGEAIARLRQLGFQDCELAVARLRKLTADESAFAEFLPALLAAFADTAAPDESLVNFERFLHSVESRDDWLRYLCDHPRATEILIRLFVGSRFLTEILIRNPGYLRDLTNHKRTAEFKSRDQYIAEAEARTADSDSIVEGDNQLRRYQQGELLRIAFCDAFRLLDLRTVTLQLSLLADAMVENCLQRNARDLGISVDGFCVLAFGKLGGEELNYSSDIDLVFLARSDSERYWKLGQQLVQSLVESRTEGFLYRVDLRLRPWGDSGALVNTCDAHLGYLGNRGALWERQAMLKARPIAGDHTVGKWFLKLAQPLLFGSDPESIRTEIREARQKTERQLAKQNRLDRDVKSGRGSIRDVEFVTQSLQLCHGQSNHEIRSANTLDALVRLADFGLIQADEHRLLSTGYVLLRSIEHSLQLMYYQQTHLLPESEHACEWLASKLDFPSAATFLQHIGQYRQSIRSIYEKYINGATTPSTNALDRRVAETSMLGSAPGYAESFSSEDQQLHLRMVASLNGESVLQFAHHPSTGGLEQITIVCRDEAGNLSLMCGLLLVYGIDIAAGMVFANPFPEESPEKAVCVNVFDVRLPPDADSGIWGEYEADLNCLLNSASRADAQSRLIERAATASAAFRSEATTLCPVEITIDNDASPTATAIHIRSEDTTGFLYELTNALTMTGVDIRRVFVNSVGRQIFDTLFITNDRGDKITDEARLRELRSAVVLIKHFTHLLPRSPNPRAALLQFREFVEAFFRGENWVEELSSLEDQRVLDTLARLLGVSTFLWDDFLRLQHANLFPVVRDVESLAIPRSREVLARELQKELDKANSLSKKKATVNEFKDREMFRIDLRYIVGHVRKFGEFAVELTDLVEIVLEAAWSSCRDELRSRFGEAQREDGSGVARMAVCALGKCGGRELGFASDIELMFVYDAEGRTDGRESIENSEFFGRLVDALTGVIESRGDGIFEIDLRLRPYGQAGNRAVSLSDFENYFASDGPAWPYERQALVKLRPIAGDAEFGDSIAETRDRLVYRGEPFDLTHIRAMREKQIHQLVGTGAVNAKLSPGGLVDCEYVVQALQLAHGHNAPDLRSPNTREAIDALANAGFLEETAWNALRRSYRFLRRLINALRMVRGNARDLNVPETDSEEFRFLSRRLGYGDYTDRLHEDIRETFEAVQLVVRSLES